MPTDEPKIIKSITPAACPHCQKTIFINHQLIQPNIAWILTPQDITQAKKNVLDRIKEIPFKNIEEKTKFKKWLNDDNTIFGYEEIDSIIQATIILQK